MEELTQNDHPAAPAAAPAHARHAVLEAYDQAEHDLKGMTRALLMVASFAFVVIVLLLVMGFELYYTSLEVRRLKAANRTLADAAAAQNTFQYGCDTPHEHGRLWPMRCNYDENAGGYWVVDNTPAVPPVCLQYGGEK